MELKAFKRCLPRPNGLENGPSPSKAPTSRIRPNIPMEHLLLRSQSTAEGPNLSMIIVLR